MRVARNRQSAIRPPQRLLEERARRAADVSLLERRFKARWMEIADIEPLVEPPNQPLAPATRRSSPLVADVYRVSDRCGMYAGAVLGAGEPSEIHFRTAAAAAVSGGALAEAVRIMTESLPPGEAHRLRAAMVTGAPTREFIRRDPNGKGFILTAGVEYEQWCDRWFEFFGAATWDKLRRERLIDPIAGRDMLDRHHYKLNVAITAIAFPWKVGRQLIEQRQRCTPIAFKELCLRKYRTNGIWFRQLMFPRDARLLGIRDEAVEKMRVSEMVAISGAHPATFEARLQWDEQRALRGEHPPVFVLLDGGVVNRPNPFDPRKPAPLPTIQIGMGCKDRHFSDTTQMHSLIERDARRSPWVFHHRAGPTRFGSLEMDKVTPRDLLGMYVLGAARASSEFDLLPEYVEWYWQQRSAQQQDPLQPTNVCRGASAIRRNLGPPVVDIVLDRLRRLRSLGRSGSDGVHRTLEAVLNQPTMTDRDPS